MKKTSLPVRSRVFLLSVISLLAVPALSPMLRANPVEVTVDGINYDVTATVTTFNDGIDYYSEYFYNQALLESQVWWGDQDLANQFAAAVGSSLGDPNFGTFSPYFAYATGDWVSVAQTEGNSAPYDDTNEYYPDGGYWYATATVVPGASVDDTTSTLALALGGLMALGFAARRLKPAVA